MAKSGQIFVISAPSGCGKTTISKRVLRRAGNLTPSVSMTTRKPRRNEKNTKDYFYVSKKRFKEKIKKGAFLEWENNFGHFYGTPKSFALKNIKNGRDLLLSIDVKGAMQVRKRFPESTLIFIKPPSVKELLRRLKGRRTDASGEIEKRIKIAKKELGYAPQYDYVVLNKDLGKAVKKVVEIIAKERKGK